MNSQQTKRLPRADIARFISDPRGITAFEALQQDTTSQYGVLTTGQFLTLDPEPALGAERVFTPVAGDLVGTDGGDNGAYTLGLANTAVAPGPYGDSKHIAQFTVDAKGRITAASSVALSPAGTYATPTGTLSRTTLASYAAGATLTFSAAYVQAEHTALAARLAAAEASLQSVSQTLAALITDMKSNGNLA